MLIIPFESCFMMGVVSFACAGCGKRMVLDKKSVGFTQLVGLRIPAVTRVEAHVVAVAPSGKV